MSFAKEDKAAWNSSEIMQEFEKIAQDENLLDNYKLEDYEPINMKSLNEEEEIEWEDEDLKEALDEFEEPKDDISEYHMAYNNSLFLNLQKIASQLAENSNIKTAYRIEQTIHNLKDIFPEDK